MESDPQTGLDSAAAAVFAAAIVATFAFAALGGRVATAQHEDGLANRSLNRWLIGLSAGATANSGFVITGAVALGYSFGTNWLLMPFGWLVGDIVFWRLFPERLNAFGRRSAAATIPEILCHETTGRRRHLSIFATTITLVGLALYLSAQWLAGQKFAASTLGVSNTAALVIFGSLVVSYSAIGRFRGSVYADAFMAVLRILSVAMIATTLVVSVHQDPQSVQQNLSKAGSGFLNPLPNSSVMSAIAFSCGWAAAAIGFGLGQPQIVSRYLAGASPEETSRSRWIYIAFVQLTWITMTLLGVGLRGLYPELPDPEVGLAVFGHEHLPPILFGILVADAFGVIASTANSTLVAMAETVRTDILSPERGFARRALPGLTIACGAATLAIPQFVETSVLSLAISAMATAASGLAVPMAVKLLGFRHDPDSLIASGTTGIICALVWANSGYASFTNEALIGIGAAALAHSIFMYFRRSS